MEAENGFNMGRSSEITRDELKFAKFINRMRVKFSELFINFLRVQLLAKQVMSDEDFNKITHKINFIFATDSYFAESKQAEILKDRVAIMRDVADYSGKFFSDRWIRKNILRQTDEDIRIMDEEIEQEQAIQLQKQQEAAAAAQEVAGQQQSMESGGGGGGGGTAPGINTGDPGQQPTQEGTTFDVSSLL